MFFCSFPVFPLLDDLDVDFTPFIRYIVFSRSHLSEAAHCARRAAEYGRRHKNIPKQLATRLAKIHGLGLEIDDQNLVGSAGRTWSPRGS
jgi:hypothetical protein